MRFIKNRLFEEQMQNDPAMKAGLAATARQVASSVKRVAPHKTGAYARSIKTDGNTVYSDDPFAHLVEWGSANNPPHAPIRRGVREAGLRLDESR